MDIKPSRIIWHHSADNSDAHQFEKIDRYHAERGFPISSMGYSVGYHYLIEPDGEIRQARAESEIGAHDSGENSNSLGICFAGDFNLRYPSEAQIKAGVRLIKDIRLRWKIPLTRVEPHRWDDSTDCPGRLLPDNWLINQFLERSGSTMLKMFHKIGRNYNLL